MQLAQSLRRRRRRRLHHQVLGALVQREGDDLADVRLVGQQHDDAVDARGRAAMRRRAVAQRVEQAGEARLDLLTAVAGDLESLDHDLGQVVPDRPRRQLDAVAHDVVLEGLDLERVHRLERLEFALGHRERVVREIDALLVLVPLEHREIHDPQRLPAFRHEAAILATATAVPSAVARDASLVAAETKLTWKEWATLFAEQSSDDKDHPLAQMAAELEDDGVDGFEDEDEGVEIEESVPMIEELPDSNRYDDDDIELV